MDDKSIIVKIKENDNEALKAIYTEMYDPVVNFLMKRGATKEDALDTFQEAIVMFYRNVQTEKFVAGHSKISTYLTAVARNLWVHKLRRQNVSKIEYEGDLIEESNKPIDKDSNPETNYIKNEDVDEMRAKLDLALSKMNERCRKLIQLYYIEQKTNEEIAIELDLANTNVSRVMKHRCLQKLRNIFREEIEKSNQNTEK